MDCALDLCFQEVTSHHAKLHCCTFHANRIDRLFPVIDANIAQEIHGFTIVSNLIKPLDLVVSGPLVDQRPV